MTAVDKTIIAASPMVQGSCESPHRIVIRDLGVSTSSTCKFDGVQKPYFHQGDYFVKTNDSHRSPIRPPRRLCKAWARFEGAACSRHSRCRSPSKVRQVADIAETIIKPHGR
jgi:hypothetical protein